MEFLFYFGVFLIGISLNYWEGAMLLLDECSNFLKDPNSDSLGKRSQDFKSLLENLKERMKGKSNLKLKNEKSSKYLDIIAQAFPRNPYQRPQGLKYEKDTFNLEENKNQSELLLNSILSFLLLEHFSRTILKPFEISPIFKAEQESSRHVNNHYDENTFLIRNLSFFVTSLEHKMLKTYKILSKLMTPVENIKVLEEVKALFQVISSKITLSSIIYRLLFKCREVCQMS
jgi:hypothetical protein